MMDTREQTICDYYISKLGIEGAKRQALDEVGNSNTDEETDFYYRVLNLIKQEENNIKTKRQ